MSVKIMSNVWDDQTITNQSELLVLLALADFSGDSGHVAEHTVTEIADKVRMTERGVQKIISRLIKDGRVKKTKEGGQKGEKRFPNSYRIVIKTEPMIPSVIVLTPTTCEEPPNVVHRVNTVQGERGERGSLVNTVPQTGERGSETGVNVVRADLSPLLTPSPSTSPTPLSSSLPSLSPLSPARARDGGSSPNSTGTQKAEPEQKRNASEDAGIPLLIRTPEFMAAWEDWKQDRKQRRKKMTFRAQELALEECLSMGVTRSVAAIKNSIKNGYIGLYEPNADKSDAKQAKKNRSCL